MERKRSGPELGETSPFSLSRRWIFILSLILFSGCTTYHPMPLTAEAVESRLQPPKIAELQTLADRIDHPLLPPVKLFPDEGLTPDGAAVLAVLLNPSLRTIRDQRALARAQLLEAGLLPNPELSSSLETPTGGNTAGQGNAFGLGLSWDVTPLISRSSRLQGAEANSASVDLEIAWHEWQVAQEARSAVYQLVSLQEQRELAEEALQRMSENLNRIRKAVASGVLTANSLNSAEAARRQATEVLLDTEKQADQQRLKLNKLIGLPGDSPIQLNKKIHLPDFAETPSDSNLLQGMEQRRLDLLALRVGYESQEAAVRAAILNQFPRITIGPTFHRDTDNVETTGFDLSLEIPLMNRNQGQIAMERATRQKLFDEYVNRVFEARSTISQLLSGIHYLNQQIAAADTAETQIADLVEIYRQALTEGRVDAQVYYDLWKDLVTARQKVVALRGQLAQSLIALQIASGRYQILTPLTKQFGTGEEKTP